MAPGEAGHGGARARGAQGGAGRRRAADGEVRLERGMVAASGSGGQPAGVAEGDGAACGAGRCASQAASISSVLPGGSAGEPRAPMCAAAVVSLPAGRGASGRAGPAGGAGLATPSGASAWLTPRGGAPGGAARRVSGGVCLGCGALAVFRLLKAFWVPPVARSAARRPSAGLREPARDPLRRERKSYAKIEPTIWVWGLQAESPSGTLEPVPKEGGVMSWFLFFVFACGGKQVVVEGDTGSVDDPDEIDTTCEVSCFEGLNEFGLNLVVLSGDTAAPQNDTNSDIPPCGYGDYEWPCNQYSDLYHDFRAEGDTADTANPLVCEDTGDIDTCVRFTDTPSYLFYDEIDTGLSADCADLVSNANNYAIDTNTGNDWEEYQSMKSTIIEATLNCENTNLVSQDNETFNIYIYNNPLYSDISFSKGRFSDSDSECYGLLFIEKSFQPPTGDYQYDGSILEHEMGHIFGLNHVCETSVSAGSDTNIMTTTTEEACCCECGLAEGQDTGDTDNAWLDACVDCSAADTGDTCLATPVYDQCDDDCVDELYKGSAALKFTENEIGDWSSGEGQLSRILSAARSYCDCACEERNQTENEEAANKWRTKVAGELDCFAGTGDFALIINRLTDSDDDDTGWVSLIPVLISGNHIGRLSWITSAEILDFGDYDHLFAAKSGYPFAFDTQDPDELDTTHLFEFDAQTTSRTWSAGLVASTNRWSTDDVDSTLTEIEWPVVRLQTQCNNDYNAADVLSLRFPPNAYRLPVKHIDSLITWKQELLIRPDFQEEWMVVELRGSPGVSQVFPLQPIPNTNKWSWSINAMGLSMAGWIQEVGNPVGSKLRIYISEGSYGQKSWNDETLPDLLKMP